LRRGSAILVVALRGRMRRRRRGGCDPKLKNAQTQKNS
jgi:hypothetical protein